MPSELWLEEPSESWLEEPVEFKLNEVARLWLDEAAASSGLADPLELEPTDGGPLLPPARGALDGNTASNSEWLWLCGMDVVDEYGEYGRICEGE